MAARRLVIVMLVLLFVSTLAAALVPVDTDQGDESRTTETSTPTSQPPGRLLGRTIEADARRAARIAIELGDQLALTVRSPRPDQVEIARLGELEDVDPDAPARFDLLPARPGSYPVRLTDAGRVIGRIVVRRRASAPDELSESRRRAGRSANTSR